MKAPRFTLRSLFVLCTIVALILGLGSVVVRFLYPFYIENFTYYVLDGPTSPSGNHVVIDVSDNFPSFSKRFRADVHIRAKSGMTLKSWFDHTGQHTAQGVREMVESMHWEDSNTLVFYALLYGEREKVVVDIP